MVLTVTFLIGVMTCFFAACDCTHNAFGTFGDCLAMFFLGIGFQYERCGCRYDAKHDKDELYAHYYFLSVHFVVLCIFFLYQTVSPLLRHWEGVIPETCLNWREKWTAFLYPQVKATSSIVISE